jgi:hypothetical protein
MEEPEVKTPVEARQGDRRRMNLRVLLVSGTLIVVLFAALYMFAYPFGA